MSQIVIVGSSHQPQVILKSIVDGLRHEIREETCAEITVGPLLLALVVLATEPLIPEIADQLLALITTPPTHNPFGEA